MRRRRNKILVLIIFILIVFLIINICYLTFFTSNHQYKTLTTRKKINTTKLTIPTSVNTTTISKYQKMINALALIPQNNANVFTLDLNNNMIGKYFYQNFIDLKFSSNNMNIKLNCFSFVNNFCDSYIVNIDNVFYFQESTPVNGDEQSYSIYKSSNYYILRTNDAYISEYRIYSNDGLFIKYYLDINVNENANYVINNDMIYLVTINEEQYDSYNCTSKNNNYKYYIKTIDLNNDLEENILSSFSAVGVAGC